MNFLHHKKTTPAKRFLSLLCVLALCLGLLPVTALADGVNAPGTLYVGNQRLSTAVTTCWTTNDQGDLTAYNDGGDNWNVKYEPSTATLTLNKAKIVNNNDTSSYPYDCAGIYALCSNDQSVSLTIVLIGENTIEGNYGILVEAQQGGITGINASLIIKSESGSGSGSNSLKVTGSGNYGISVKSGTGDASLTIENTTVNASTSGGHVAGVYVQSGVGATSSPRISLAVNGGSLTASGGTSSDGILFYVGSSNATATTSLTVSGNAIVDAKSGGISATQDMSQFDTTISTTGSNGGIVFDGTEGTVYGDVTLDKSLTINQGETLTVPEGSSLDCNEKLTNNGTILVESGGTVSGNLSGGTTLTTPTITEQSTDKTVTAGETATFSVAASDAQTYQWQQKTSDSSDWEDISGATSATYTTAATTTDMSGNQYRCMVKSASGVGVISQVATLTVEEKTVPVTGVSLDKTSLSLYTGDSATLTATIAPSDATNPAVTWASDKHDVATVENGTVTAVGAGTATITVTTKDGSHTATCQVTVKSRPSYNPPTVSEKTIDAIQDAQPGETVTVDLSHGSTKLDKEVFETLAGKDITLVVELSGGLSWTINGSDIPENAELSDLDLGVTMNSDGIPVDLINAITGEHGSVQMTLAHDGAFGFTMTLTAPLGAENAGYWANLYYYKVNDGEAGREGPLGDDEDTNAMTFETAAQIGDDGSVSLPFSHASQYVLVIDDHNHGVITLPFTDVANSDWFYEPVCFVYSQGLMTGTSATTFEPNTYLSRAMLVAILHRLEGSPAASGGTFSDVAEGDWYAEAVNWAASVGVVNGFDDGSFQPNTAITREQMAAILRNYAEYKGLDVSASGDLSTYSDANSVSSWAKESIAWAVGQGLLSGMTEDTLQPQGLSTRAQVAAVLQRALGNVAGNQ